MLLFGFSSLKHLQAYNIVIVLGGVAVLGVGVWMVMGCASFRDALENLETWGPTIKVVQSSFQEGLRRAKDISLILITAGSLGVILGAIGCFSTYTRLLLFLYSAALFVVVIMEIGAAIAFSKSAPHILAAVEAELNEFIPKYDLVQTHQGFRNRVVRIPNQRTDNNTVAATMLVNIIQVWVGCCGESGYTDFNQTTFWNKTDTGQHVPVYCCKFKNWQHLELVDPDCLYVRTPENSWMNVGCVNKTEQLIHDKFPVVTATSVIVSLVDIGAIIFAMGLAFSIGKPGYFEL